MRKVKFRFFTIADYEEEENWLREQHKSGLRLVKTLPPCGYVFEPCSPEDVIYRLDYRNGRQNREYMQLFQDYGWEYFTSCVGWMYFRKPAAEIEAENDGEIFSDRDSKLEMIRKIMKTRMFPLLIIFLTCLLPNWLGAVAGSFGLADVFFGGLFTGLVLLYVFLLIHCGWKLKKLEKKYTCK